MSDKDLERHYATLELARGASPTEVKNAYLRLKKLYTEESRLLAVLTADFPPDRRAAILKDIDEAYQVILASFRPPAAETEPAPDIPFPDKEEAARGRTARDSSGWTGAGLKRQRQALGIPLTKIYQTTKIRVEILENIEEERFEALPDETFLKTHLDQYARCLGLDPKKVVEDYLQWYGEWKRRRARAGEHDRNE